MSQEKLGVFARLRPSSYDSAQTNIPILIKADQMLTLQVNRAKMSNAKEQLDYYFNHVFDENINQQDIFRLVAKPVIDNCLSGYNGTIFAYGQTGSGKTYTMSGGDDWEQRGIIPRVLSYVFDQFQRNKKKIKYQMTVSFIQIYNESAYDLLDQKHSQSNFQQWSKVLFMQDEENNFKIKNGSIRKCKNQQEALSYLMMGNYIRKVSCTNLNETSSRSHCIFTLNIKGTFLNEDSQVEVYSKINLVDLAGSQRVSKSHAQGIVLTQAKSINLSLTYLQQVIVSLNEKSKNKGKSHIPYRNSLLTTLLKDSLGGNCKTVMIATISTQLYNIQQTMSTLRFSQRVKQIKNQVVKNQKNITTTKIEMLERQNLLLRKKLQKYQRNQFIKTPLLSQKIPHHVQKFMNGQIQKIIEFEAQQEENSRQITTCFTQMRKFYRKKMQQYAKQLEFISQKINMYDKSLQARKKQKN